MLASEAKARLGIGTALGLALWAVVPRLPFLFVDTLGWDEGFYMIAGKELLAGKLPYVDVWDYRPVGFYLIYAALMSISGTDASGVVVGSMLAVLATTLLVAFIGTRVFASRRVGIFAGILFPAYMLVCEGDGANAENFFIVFGALSFLVVGTHLRRPAEMTSHRPVAFAFGLIQGVALQIKFLTAPVTAMLGLVFGLVVLSERRRLRDGVELFASFLAGYLLPTAAALACYWWIGQLHEMVFANFISAAGYAKSAFGLSEPVRSLKAIMWAAYGLAPLMLATVIALFAVVAPILWAAPARATAPYWLLVAWLAGATLSATYTGNFFDHYFIVMTPPLSVLAALALDRLAGEGAARRVALVALGLLVAFPLFLDGRNLYKRLASPIVNPARAIADEVKRLVPPGTSIFIVNLTPQIYVLSDTWPTGRFAFSWQLTEDRFLPYGIDVEREVERIFAPRPELVLVDREYYDRRPSSTAPLFLDRVARDYEEVEIADEALRKRVAIFRRRPDRK